MKFSFFNSSQTNKEIEHTFYEHARPLFEIIEKRTNSSIELTAKRLCVNELVLRNSSHVCHPNFQSISSEDLGMLFHAIDETFFDGEVTPLCEVISCKPLQFRLSTRMTSTGGTTTMKSRGSRFPQRHFEIAIATTPLFETFRIESKAHVGGLECNSRLDALQRIMEHEMVHLVEMLLWQNSNCSASRYRQIVKRIFGHTESKHRMLTPRDVAHKEIGVTVGKLVSFEHDGQTLTGIVNRISKRATVLVSVLKARRVSKTAEGILFTDGNRYLKFYVPLNRLRPAN